MIRPSGLNIQTIRDKKTPFAGTFHGMHYYVAKEDEEIAAYVFPEPWCFDKTPSEDKVREAFPADKEGLEEAILWINARFEEDIPRWEEADRTKMEKLLK